jgi:tetratricopeptide (TPR) repeat protein
VQLGRAWSRKGRYSRALDAFREVERLQPFHKLIRYYLGANLMYEGKDLDTAEAHLRAFIADPPGDEWRGWAHERLGDIYQKRKQPDMALVFWKRALRDSPDDEAVRKKIDRARKKGAVPAKGVPEITPVPKPTP